MSEGAGAALSATSGRGLLPLCGGVGPPGAGVFSSPQLQICGLSSVAVEGLGAVLRSISGVAEAVPKPLTRGESPLQPPRSATKSTGRSTRAAQPDRTRGLSISAAYNEGPKLAASFTHVQNCANLA